MAPPDQNPKSQNSPKIKPILNDGYKSKGTKPTAGRRAFGKFIGKAVRGTSDKVKLVPTPPDDMSQDKRRFFQMGLESYQRALQTGDQRRIRGIRSAGIIVHAENVHPNWRIKQTLQGREVTDIDQLARLAYDNLVDADMNTVHFVYLKKNKIVSQVSFPKNYPLATPQDMSNLQDDILKQLQDMKLPKADGYYTIQNYPDTKMNVDVPEMHRTIAKKFPGYMGGLIITPGFQYGYVQLQGDTVQLQEKQLPIPAPGDETVPGYDGPYTVLNHHQNLLGKPTLEPNKPIDVSNLNISKISQHIERARDTTLLIYSKNNKTVGIQEIPNSLFKKSKKFNDYAKSQINKYGADEVIAVVDKNKIHGAKPAIQRTTKKLALKLASLDTKTLATSLLDTNLLE
jgi:hypothetical protein